MDTAGELAKCREQVNVDGFRWLTPGFRERLITALLVARADALREFTAEWDEPELCYIAEELEREVQARRMRGL